MGTPTLKLVFDHRHRASPTTEGAIELRITYNCEQRHATTGVKVLPRQCSHRVTTEDFIRQTICGGMRWEYVNNYKSSSKLSTNL